MEEKNHIYPIFDRMMTRQDKEELLGQHSVMLSLIHISEENHRQFFIPRGFAHGFAVLSETAVFQYKCDNFYAPQHDGGISILEMCIRDRYCADCIESHSFWLLISL